MPRRLLLVLDAGPLIALAAAGGLDVLARLDASLLLPEAVAEEVLVHAHPSLADSGRIEAFLTKAPVERVRPRDAGLVARVAANPRLSRADASALVVAQERGGCLVADDRSLRAAARAMGVPLGGSLFLISLAVDQGLLSRDGAVELVRRMVAAGWYCSPTLFDAFRSEMSR
jgi:predicted nucleic acid-binding protein